MQTGLECVGDIGEYEICETLLLAAKSLEAAGCDFRLDIAHTGILTAFMDSLALTEKKKNELLTCIKRKNTKGIQDICDSLGSDRRVGDAFASIIGLMARRTKYCLSLKLYVAVLRETRLFPILIQLRNFVMLRLRRQN